LYISSFEGGGVSGEDWGHPRWLAQNLRLGYESAVRRAVSFVEASQAQNVPGLQARLQRVGLKKEPNDETKAQ